MKKTMLSLAAASLVMGTAAYADVNVDLGGQAKFYYETNEKDGAANDLFDQDASKAAVGIQLNANADLGNGFGFGSQATFLDNWGMDTNIAAGMPQQVDSTNDGITTDIALTQLYLSKKINNTTVKGGRQEVSKGISPLVYSEGWNVFKNTVDGVVVSNTDVADTTLVAAYFSAGNSTTADMNTFNEIQGGVYMVAAATKAIPNTDLTLNYYHKAHEEDNATGAAAVDAIWADAQIAIPDVPVKIGLQYGNLDSDATGSNDTTAFGVKVSGKVANVSLTAAYTAVDDGNVAVKNWATNVKSPLYTQMIYNQFYIAGGNGVDVNTWLVGATADFGDMGKLIANYSSCNTDTAVDSDRTELDVIYKIKANGVQYFAAYVMNDIDDAPVGPLTADNDKVRFWAAYAF